MPRPVFAVMFLFLSCSALALLQRDWQPVQERVTDTEAASGGDTAALSARPTGNSPPVAFDDSYTTGFGEELSVSPAQGLLANDFDPDGDTIFVQSFTSASFGNLSVTTDGSFSYTPDPGASGVENLVYTISDGFETDQGALTITVTEASVIFSDRFEP